LHFSAHLLLSKRRTVPHIRHAIGVHNLLKTRRQRICQSRAPRPIAFCGKKGYGTYLNDMPKRTYQPKKRKRATTHGFLARSGTKGGARVLKSRRRKGRRQLAVKAAR
jgi:large subunit ribosomal protein L34